MPQSHTHRAVAYYQAMSNKDIALLATYLHPQIHLISPFVDVTGKEAALASISYFCSVFTSLSIRSHCESHDEAVVIYDVSFEAPIGHVRSAALLTFKEELIIRCELFFDARPFAK
jgi:hypothetical protein